MRGDTKHKPELIKHIQWWESTSQLVYQECKAPMALFIHTWHAHWLRRRRIREWKRARWGNKRWDFYLRRGRPRHHMPHERSCSYPAACASFCSIPACVCDTDTHKKSQWRENRAALRPHTELIFTKVIGMTNLLCESYHVCSSYEGEQRAAHGQQHQTAVEIQHRGRRSADAQSDLKKTHTQANTVRHIWLM